MIASNRQKMLVRPIPISRFQNNVLESKAWLRGYVGGRNAGKSKVGSIWISKYAKDGYPCMCVCPDANVAVETSFQSMVETVKYTGQYIKDVQSPLPKVVFRTWDGGVADIVFKSAEVPKKIRGPSKAMLWIDEAQIISEEAFQVAIGVCRYRRKMSPVLATFTPFGFRHWTFEAFFRQVEDHEIKVLDSTLYSWFNGKAYEPKPDTQLIHCATKDNPFAPKEYVRLLGQNYSSRMRDQELEGLYLEIAGLMFERAKFKLVDEAPVECQRIRYWDKACVIGSTLVVTKRGEVPIESIKDGDFVLTRSGFCLVQFAGETKQVDHICTVVFNNGSAITGTSDHLVLTKNRNWVELETLGDGDLCIGIDEAQKWADPETKILKSLTSTDYDMQESNRIGISIQIAGIKKKNDTTIDHCIETSGSIPTALFPTAIISTTLTKIGTTTTYRICNVSRLKTIAKSTLNSINQELRLVILNIEKKHNKLFGIGSKKTVVQRNSKKRANREGSIRGQVSREKSMFAKAVHLNLNQEKTDLLRGSVQSLVMTKQDQSKRKVFEYSTVRYVVRNFQVREGRRLVRMNADRLRDCKPISVFDLTVDQNHEFFANGVLVHNSTHGDGCFSAGALIARARNGQVFIEHIIRGQWSALERNEVMIQIAESDYQKYGGTVQTYIEQEGAGSGKEINDQMMIMLGKYPVYTDNASTSAVKTINGVKLPGDAKIRRSMPLSAQVEAGNVSIVSGRFVSDFLDEISLYPEYRFTDQVDAVSAGYNKLMSFGPDNLASERYTGDAGLRQYGRALELTESDRRSDIYRTRLPWNN